MANTDQGGDDNEESKRIIVQNRLWAALHRSSRQLIYMSLQRSGGEPFGAPFEPGLATLTDRVVRFFKQRSFFNFSSAERLQRRADRNKFTRHGASPYHGIYTQMPALQQSRGLVARFVYYLQDNRFFLFAALQRPPMVEDAPNSKPPTLAPAQRKQP